MLPVEDADRKMGSIGILLPSLEARLVEDEEGDKDAAEGEPGELWIRGKTVMKVKNFRSHTDHKFILSPGISEQSYGDQERHHSRWLVQDWRRGRPRQRRILLYRRFVVSFCSQTSPVKLIRIVDRRKELIKYKVWCHNTTLFLSNSLTIGIPRLGSTSCSELAGANFILSL
jgi:acyl-CoA synthetase (AMP-forming)/AMP-acid ligase II